MPFRFRQKFWPVVPGLVVAGFALAAIVLPVGSDGLGARVGNEPGLVPASARWARDIHDGYWRDRAAVADLTGGISFRTPLSSDRRRALELCWLGQAREAVALYQQIGVLLDVDREALYHLNARLICDADYDLCEWYAREADRLLGGASLRNNVAWHYTQTGIRQQQCLDLALSSVADSRSACNVDTLAWAYLNAGDRARARKVALETLEINEPYLSDLSLEQQQLAKDSSRRLLARLDGPAQQEVTVFESGPAQYSITIR